MHSIQRPPIQVLRQRVFAAFVVVSSVFMVPGTAAETSRLDRGKFIAQIPNVGSLTLELDGEYRGTRSAKLLWLFAELPGVWSESEGTLVFHRRPARSEKPDAKPTLIFRRENDGTLGLIGGDVLDEARASFFGRYPWRSADAEHTTDPRGADAAAFYRAVEQTKRFKVRGELRALPEDFPSEFMDASALLFRDREHEILALLEYPKLSQDVVEIVGNGILAGEVGQFGTLFITPVLGANPSLSPGLQEKLFALPKAAAVWRAVAGNPSAPKTFHAEYLRLIRDGEMDIRFQVARDQKAPREAWELALAANEAEVLSEFARNTAAPPDLISQVAETVIRTDPVSLAANPATPADLLNQLSKTQVDVYAGLSKDEQKKNRALLKAKQLQSSDKQVLWAIKRNPSAPAEAVERVLRTLATCTAADIRSTCPDDPRLPPDLIEKLSKDPSIQVRIVLAMNTAVSLPVLERLAEDPYQMVSERARDNMKKRFPAVWTSHSDRWVPLKDLNPHNSLSQDIEQAVLAGDPEKTRALLQSTEDPDLRPDPSAMVRMILQRDAESFAALLKEMIIEGGPAALETMVVSPKLTPEGLRWLVEEKLLDPQIADRLALHATENGRTDLLQEAHRLGVLSLLSAPVRDYALFVSVATRSNELVDFWMTNGGNPDAPVRDGVSPAGLAVTLRVPELLARLDKDGDLAKAEAAIKKEFPSRPDSPFLGTWVNKRSDDLTCAFVLRSDGSGVLGTASSSAPILWKTNGEDQLVLVAVGPNGPVHDQLLSLQYDKNRDQFFSNKNRMTLTKGEDLSPFSRLAPP